MVMVEWNEEGWQEVVMAKEATAERAMDGKG